MAAKAFASSGKRRRRDTDDPKCGPAWNKWQDLEQQKADCVQEMRRLDAAVDELSGIRGVPPRQAEIESEAQQLVGGVATLPRTESPQQQLQKAVARREVLTRAVQLAKGAYETERSRVAEEIVFEEEGDRNALTLEIINTHARMAVLAAREMSMRQSLVLRQALGGESMLAGYWLHGRSTMNGVECSPNLGGLIATLPGFFRTAPAERGQSFQARLHGSSARRISS